MSIEVLFTVVYIIAAGMILANIRALFEINCTLDISDKHQKLEALFVANIVILIILIGLAIYGQVFVY